MRTRARTGVGLAVLLGLLVSGCGSEPAGPGDAGSSSVDGAPDGIAGEFIVDADGGWDPVDGVDALITFEEGAIEFYGGCNRLTGDLSWDGDTLVTAGLGGTEIGCPQGLNEQDTWFADFLAGRPRATMRGDDIELTSGATTVYLVPFVVIPDAELVGTTWLLTGIEENDGDVGSLQTTDGTRTTFRFDDDGTVALGLSCNAAGSTYSADGNRIRFGDIESDGEACLGADGDIERQVTQILDAGGLKWGISEDRLHLQEPARPGGAFTAKRGLHFVAE